MSELQTARTDIAPSVRVLLAAFHAETRAKLAAAPEEGPAWFVDAEGTSTEVDEDGWLNDCDNLDADDAIAIQPLRVVDTEVPSIDGIER